MKRLTARLLIIISILSNVGHAFELPNACKELKQSSQKKGNECISCAEGFALTASKPTPLKGLGEDLARALKEYTYLNDKMYKLENAKRSLKDSQAPLYRTLRDGIVEPSYKESMVEINAIRADFDRLTMLSKEGALIRNKANKNLFNLPGTWLQDLWRDLEIIQKAKIAILIKHPILANKVFEDKLQEEKLSDQFIASNELFSEKEFHALLKSAEQSSIQNTLNGLGEIGEIEFEGERPIARESNKKYIAQYVKDIVSRHPKVIEEIIQMSSVDGTLESKEETELLCAYAEEYEKYAKSKAIKDVAVDAALFILPLATGPLAPELLYLRLASWGVKGVRTAEAAAVAAQMTSIALDVKGLKEQKDKCSRLEILFYAKTSEDNLKKLKECKDDYSDQLLTSQLGLLTTVVSPLAKLAKAPVSIPKQAYDASEVATYIQQNGLKELSEGQVALEFYTKKQGVFSVFDLNEVVKSGSDKLKDIPVKYWTYIGQVYEKRLNLTKKEIDDFIDSSVKMSSRTKLIMNTEASTLKKEMKINGGVGIVSSSNPSELLPLEKATGIRIARKPNEKIEEIVRLTADANLSKALVGQALHLIESDKKVSRIFIYTSRAHGRLYQGFGVDPKQITPIIKDDLEKFIKLNKREPNKEELAELKKKARDVLIELPREHIEKVIKQGPLTPDKLAGLGSDSSEYIQRAI